MPRIRCHYNDCVFIDEGYCSAAAVEIDPDTGCATYAPADGATGGDDQWEDEEELEEWEEDEVDEEDTWSEDEEDEF